MSLNEAEQETHRSLKIKIVKIKNNQKHFVYSVDAISLGHYNGMIVSPVIVVITNNSLGGISSKNDANMNWISYMSDSAFLCPSFKTIRAGISKYNLTKYIGSNVNTKSYVLKKIKDTQNSLIISTLTISIAILIALVENTSFNFIYFNNNRKKISIKHIMGATFFKKYGKFSLLILGLSVLESTIVLMVTTDFEVSIALFFISNLIEFLLLYFQNVRLSKNTEQIIKGE